MQPELAVFFLVSSAQLHMSHKSHYEDTWRCWQGKKMSHWISWVHFQFTSRGEKNPMIWCYKIVLLYEHKWQNSNRKLQKNIIAPPSSPVTLFGAIILAAEAFAISQTKGIRCLYCCKKKFCLDTMISDTLFQIKTKNRSFCSNELKSTPVDSKKGDRRAKSLHSMITHHINSHF